MNERKNLKMEVFKVYFMIGLFALYFIFSLTIIIATIVFNVVALIEAIKEPVWFVSFIWLLPLSYIVYIVEVIPIIALFRSNSNYKGGIEVTEKDAPLLFATIRDVVELVKCKMPKHVYISDDARAEICFDNVLVSIFIPNSQSLTIGIDLFSDTNVSELKSIIAHELGHFSQKTMHAGSCVYAAEILCDMYKQIIGLAGNGPLGPIWLLRKQIISLIYKGIHNAHRSLQRRMEFDADEVAASIMGTNCFVSALCKISVLKYQYKHFNGVLEALCSQDIQVYDELVCHDIWWNLFPHKSIYNISPSMTLSQLPHDAASGFITIRDKAEETHPTTEARIENLISMHFADKAIDTTPSHSIFPSIIWEKQKDLCLKEQNWQYYDEIAFTDYCTQFAKDNYGYGELYNLLDHIIPEFDIETISTQPDVKLPQFADVQCIIDNYTSTQNDEWTLRYLEKGLVNYSSLQYKGQKVKSVSDLRELHRKDVIAANEKILQLDKQIVSYLLSQCNSEMELTKICTLYRDIFIFQKGWYDLQSVKLGILVMINKDTIIDQDGETHVDIHREEKAFKEIIAKFDSSWLKQYLDDDTVNNLLKYAKESYHYISYTDWNKINEFISIIEWTAGVLYNGADKCKIKLSKINFC